MSKVQKTLIFGYFGYESAKIAKMRFFFENRASSLFSTYLRATSCQKSKRSYGGKYDNFCDGQTSDGVDDITNIRYESDGAGFKGPKCWSNNRAQQLTNIKHKSTSMK